MSFSIYDLDDEIRELLKLDHFLEGMTVNEFIEELSKDHFLKGAEVNKLEYLDPKPYIRTFESTLREIKQLTVEAESEQSHMEKQVEDYELKHSQNVLELTDKLDQIIRKFSDLDLEISDVANQINPLSNNLNKITNSRDISTETIFLIRAYHGFFTKEKYDPLEALRVSRDYDDKLKCAKTLNYLLILARKIETPSISKSIQCIKAIEKFSETMERELLNKFEVALESDEYEMMKDIASILLEFNGGANVIQTFVSKNDVLDVSNEDSQARSILDDESVWAHLSDPAFADIIKDEQAEELLMQLKFNIKGHARIVKQVFENPVPVLKIFIQRMYAQMIQNKVHALLQFSLTVSSLAHVRILHTLYLAVNDFTKDLKEFFTTNEFDQDHELSSILDQSMYDLFIEFTSEDAYFAREKKNLEDIIYNIVQAFNTDHEKVLSNRHLAVKLENLNNMDYNLERDSHTNDRFGFRLSERKRYNQFKDFMKTHLADVRSKGSGDINSAEEHNNVQLDIENVKVVIKSIIEAVARVLELEPNKSAEYSLELLEILLFDFGKLYVESGLEVVYDSLKQEGVSTKVSSNQKVNLSFLASFNLIGEILFTMSSCVKKVILPCSVNAPNIRNRMSSLTNNHIARCELSINIILNETVELISNKVSFSLSKQKKKDFIVDNITEDYTEACEETCEFLEYVHDTLKASLNDGNLFNLKVKIGISFLNLVLDHFKKFNVNSTGGIILTRDAIRYQSVIDSWDVPELSENFQILKEVGNLFTVHPNLINSLVTEGQLATMKPFTIRQYISKRTDFNPSYIERFFSFK